MITKNMRPVEKMKKKKQDKYIHLLGTTYPVVIAIDPATTSGYAIWKNGGLKEWGIIRNAQEENPFIGYKDGLLVIESQYLAFNPQTSMRISEIKGMFKVRAGDEGFVVAEQNTKTWQSAIGAPIKMKRKEVKIIAMRYAENLIIGKGIEQDAADAICIGQTFIDKYRIRT